MFKYTKQELYVNLNPSVKFFLHHARPLSVIEGKYDNFIYANYIQLNKNASKRYLFDIYPQFGNGATFGSNIIDDLLENYIISGDYVHYYDEARVYRKIEVDMRIAYDSIFSREMTEYLASEDRVRPFNEFMLDFYKFKVPLYEYNYSTERVLQKIEKSQFMEQKIS